MSERRARWLSRAFELGAADREGVQGERQENAGPHLLNAVLRGSQRTSRCAKGARSFRARMTGWSLPRRVSLSLELIADPHGGLLCNVQASSHHSLHCGSIGVDRNDVGLDAVAAESSSRRASSELSRGKMEVRTEISDITQHLERDRCRIGRAPLLRGSWFGEERPPGHVLARIISSKNSPLRRPVLRLTCRFFRSVIFSPASRRMSW